MSAAWASRYRTGSKAAAARARSQERLDICADALMQLEVRSLRNVRVPAIKEGGRAATVAIRIGGFVEPIVNEAIGEWCRALSAMTDSQLRHGVPFEA